MAGFSTRIGSSLVFDTEFPTALRRDWEMSQQKRLLKWAGIAATVAIFAGCAIKPPPITYQQVGACNVNEVGAHDHMAFVFFRVQSIDNSHTDEAWTFDPKNLFINTGDLYSGYDYIASGQQALLNNLPFLGPIPVAADRAPFNVDKYLVFLLQTTDADGPTEANSTSYFLLYHNPPNEVGKLLIRSNAQQTTWPNTHRCSDIAFPR